MNQQLLKRQRQKELKTFFNTIEGYLAIMVFFIISTLIIWFIPSEYNIIYNNQASLLPFFSISKWVLLFLIPTITMKMISIERLQKTTIILFTKPIKTWEIIFAKFLASCSIGLLSILPSLIFVYSIYHLSEPIGNIDKGELIGSYIGLSCLICVYSAIGIFSSSLTKNTMISFITTIIVILFLLFGIDYIRIIYDNSMFQKFSMMYHYESISRGVLDSRNLIYFISLTTCFIIITTLQIRQNKG